MNALLRMAKKNEYIGKLPPVNMESGGDLADFSMGITALDETYGTQGSRLLALRAGMAVIDESLKNICSL